MKAITAVRVAYKAFLRQDERARFILAERLAGLIYPRYKFSEFGRPYLYDEPFLKVYETFERSGNYHSLDRKYALDQFMKIAVGVAGDTVECGAYKGASSYLICRRIEGLGKRHCVFDSFEGLSTPDENDGSYWTAGDLRTDDSEIRRNLRDFDFVDYYPGWIPERFGEVEERQFCFVHLDVDLYQPTYDSLKFFYPRMPSGAVLICDDYFTSCPGAVLAMDTYFADRPEEVVALPTGQAFIVKQ
jgi:hypothetical protein